MLRVNSLNAGPSSPTLPGVGPVSPLSEPRNLPRPAARHPLESITPTGLVLLAALAVSAGLGLAVLLKLLSLALRIS